MLSNLVESAAKFSPDHESVELRVEADDDVVAVSVADRGRGIPPDDGRSTGPSSGRA